MAFVCVAAFGSTTYGQNKKYITVKNDHSVDRIILSLKGSSGKYYINPSHTPHPIGLYGDARNDHCVPVHEVEHRENDKHVEIAFKEIHESGMGGKLSKLLFGGSSSEDAYDYYNLYLSHLQPFVLNLNYAVGEAHVDLSGLSVEKLNIQTGNASVYVDYQRGNPNKIFMDTLNVKVDMGDLSINRLDLSKARQVFADIGFGNLSLNFSEQVTTRSNINAKLAAGSLEVVLPSADTPVVVRIHNSPLCRVNLSSEFTQIRDNVFANRPDAEFAENALSFDIDVGMGSIKFAHR